MNRRLLLAALVLALLAVSAGCAGFFGSDQIDPGQLNESADYGPGWESDADVWVDRSADEYQAVYTLSNRSSITIYRFEELNDEGPVDVSAVQFRHPNGTVVDASRIDVERTDSGTVITPPATTGKLAFTAPASGRTFRFPVVLEGSYEVVLPQGMRADLPVLSSIRPRGYETSLEDGRVHVRWSEVSSDAIRVQYYLARDKWIFGGLVAVLGAVALVGAGYIWLQIRRLVRQRRELGLDVDIEDDGGGGGRPPFR